MEQKPRQATYGMNSSKGTLRQGVSATDFLKNLEMEDENREMMFMDDSIVGLEDESHLTKLLQGKLDQLRLEMMDYSILKGRDKEEIDQSQVPLSANIILFGPSGSGKSSVIRTVYTALNGVFHLPQDIQDKLLIKKLSSNEGTVKFTQVQIKKPAQNVLKAGGVSYEYKNSGINMFDTRGQILLDEKEKEALGIMIEVKTMSIGKS